GRGQRESRRSRSSSKRPSFEQRSESIRDRRARHDGLQINSLAGQLPHVRLQTSCRAAHPDVKAAQCARRSLIPSAAESYAPHDRQEIREGNFSIGFAGSRGLTTGHRLRKEAVAPFHTTPPFRRFV